MAEKGNTNSASDAGVAALMARAGVEGAVLNVLINLGSVKDEAFKQACRDETRQPGERGRRGVRPDAREGPLDLRLTRGRGRRRAG